MAQTDATHQATVVLRYQGNDYTIHKPMWGDDEFIWTDGNYSCDCNRLAFIAEEHPDAVPDEWNWEDAKCGDTIELVSLAITAQAPTGAD